MAIDWDDIEEARKVLGLEEKATLNEIKSAFRRLARKNHPDLSDDMYGHQRMRRLNHAYQLLTDYCSSFRFPLKKGPDAEIIDDEKWWLDRFGTDPLWGKSRHDKE